ncbi:MAG: histone deacetylase [Anaerolineales bacterium]
MHPIAYFYPTGHQSHSLPGHPERPERVEAIVAALTNAGWWEPYPKLNALELPNQVLRAIHTRRHLSYIETTSCMGGRVDPDTYLTPQTWELALQAAGGAASVAAAVWLGKAQRGFALARPPGHHATPDRAMGFCLLNNVALAAEYLIQEHGAQRLAIVDLDVHHGNGTQDIFYRRGDVLFISTHQWPLYPGTGWLDKTGQGAGKGATVNLPLPPLSGDRAYLAAMEEVILPVIDRFSPEMILVSAGMDAHWRDPLANLLLSGGAYGELVGSLAKWADENCQGRIALVWEGGYDLEGGAACAVGAVAALLGEAFDDPVGRSPWQERENWRRVVDGARQLWGTQD